MTKSQEIELPSIHSSDSTDKSSTSEESPVLKWVQWTVRRPKTVCLGTISVPLFLFFLFVLLLMFGAFEISTDIILEDRNDPYWEIEKGYSLAIAETQKSSGTVLIRSRVGGVLDIIFEAQGGTSNVLTEDNVKKMREIEQKVVQDPEYSSFCFAGASNGTSCEPPVSILNYFYPQKCVENCNLTGEWIYNGKGTEMQPFQETLELMATFEGWFANVGGVVDKNFGPDNLQSKISRIYFQYGWPLEGYENEEDRKEEQEKKIGDFNIKFLNFLKGASTKQLRVLFFGSGITDKQFGDMVNTDLILALASITFVYLYLAFQLRSIWLSSMAISQILLSFPSAIIIYQYIFQITHLGILQILAIYIVLGVGADGMFVFVDTWKLSASQDPSISGDLEKRMNWVYKRAAKALLVTSSTTFIAFVATAVTPLVSLQTFGIFSALLVIVNYVLVITFFPSVIIIYHNNWENIWCGLCCCCQRHPKAVVDEANDKVQRAHTKTLTDKFFINYYAPFVVAKRNRYFILLGTALVVIFFLIFAAQTKPEEKPLQALREGHPLRDVFDLQEDFQIKSDLFVVTVSVIWGIKGVDKSKGDRMKETKPGEIIWDDDFDITLASTQEAVKKMCEEGLERHEALHILPNDKVNCFVADFDKWMLEEKGIATRVTGQTFVDYIKEFLTVYPYDKDYSGSIGFVNDRIRFVTIYFNTSLPSAESYVNGNPIKDVWKEFVDEMNDEAPSGANKAVPYMGAWSWFNVQSLLFKQAWIGISVSMALSLLILVVFTMNPVISIFAIFSIGCIVVCLLGVLHLLNWDIGVVESIAAIMVVGFSVDYTVHLAHSYLEAPFPGRLDRTRTAIETMGSSILSGAISTLGSCFILLFTEITYFVKYGTIIVCIIGFSLLLSLLLFAPLCATIGPENNFANLKPHVSKLIKKIKARFGH